MEHHHDRPAVAIIEVGEQVEHFDLVSEVEEGRRLVEQHQRRALGKSQGDPRPLPLPAGELVDEPVAELS